MLVVGSFAEGYERAARTRWKVRSFDEFNELILWKEVALFLKVKCCGFHVFPAQSIAPVYLSLTQQRYAARRGGVEYQVGDVSGCDSICETHSKMPEQFFDGEE